MHWDKAARESVLHLGINEAPVGHPGLWGSRGSIPFHAIEAGAAATQNMTLAATSLGLGAGWIGIWGTEAETSIRKIFKFPETLRIVSLLPVGLPAESPESHRKPIEEISQFR